MGGCDDHWPNVSCCVVVSGLADTVVYHVVVVIVVPLTALRSCEILSYAKGRDAETSPGMSIWWER